MFKVSGLAISYKYILDNVNINFWFTQPWFKKKKYTKPNRQKEMYCGEYCNSALSFIEIKY